MHHMLLGDRDLLDFFVCLFVALCDKDIRVLASSGLRSRRRGQDGGFSLICLVENNSVHVFF